MQTEVTVNTEWFRNKLAEREMSMRGLARKIELDPASVSLMLRGKRRMTTAEANKIATILGIQVTEVLRQAGVPVSQDAHMVALTGTIDAKGKVKELKSGARQMAPHDVPTDGVALQVRCPSSPADGWVIFCSSAKSAPETTLERFCVVHLTSGSSVVGTLRKGYEKGTFNVFTSMPSESSLENVSVSSVSSVLWIRPR
jgi:DNA-binding Xre family transcriptional regulator